MGFYSSFITSSLQFDWPEWFVAKWSESVHFPPIPDFPVPPGFLRGPISSKIPRKAYRGFAELPADIMRVLTEANFLTGGDDFFELIYLHECGGITMYRFGRSGIRVFEPRTWEETEDITHDCCLDCSHVEKKRPTND